MEQLSPIQEMIRYIETVIGLPKEEKINLSNDELMAYHNILTHLRSKLQYEKSFMEQTAIAFAEWVSTEGYTDYKSGGKKWHTIGSYGHPSYTIEQVFEKFIKEYKK